MKLKQTGSKAKPYYKQWLYFKIDKYDYIIQNTGDVFSFDLRTKYLIL